MINDLAKRDWDVIVIGTGIGGGTAGRRLAEAGLKVLFVERGPVGYRAEETPLDQEMFVPEARLARGFWPDQVQGTVDGKSFDFFAPLGAGVGGSSVFYAATLERPEPHDLDDSDERPHPTGGWPVPFAEMRPWLDEAERLYHVSGEEDPLSQAPSNELLPPLPVQPGDAALMEGLRRNGMHPYRLHSAIRHLDGCKECLGFKCPRACKMDGRSAGVEPALATGNASVLDMCRVTAVRGNRERATHLEAERDGRQIELRARAFLLAGGALGSASLLLSSQSEDWPDGFANRSGLVGRNLMFHLNEMIAVWPKRAARFDGPSKAISLRDLYFREGQRFGTVQAMGIDASYGEIAFYLRTMVERSWLNRIPLAAELSRIPAAIAAKLFGSAKIFVGLIEDMPDANNRVLRAEPPGRIRFTYDIAPELMARRRAFRRAIRRAFRGFRHMFLGFQPEPNYGHPCGTLRFGNDPETSVLDRECRAHEVANLWVADASFMPSSAGVNPSLIIAANALRVADRLAERLKEGSI
jgi:choline dehydrogenase-like flavoprotein